MLAYARYTSRKEDCFMSDEQEKHIQKELLWDYMEAEKKLEAFRALFSQMASQHKNISELLLKRPETIRIDMEQIRLDAEKLQAAADEYKELLVKNSERRSSLTKMGVNLPRQ
jgi:hypothetical protein